MDRGPRHDLFPYLLVALLAASLFFLFLLDRQQPLFSTPEGMAPFIFILFAFSALLAHYASQASAFKMVQEGEPELHWRRFGIVGGGLAGLVFLAVYWAYDWPAPNREEISERQVNELCRLAEPVPPEWINQSTPDPLDLVPGFVGMGMALGLVVGLLFPWWYRRIEQSVKRHGRMGWLAHPYPSGLLFGVLFGALIGAWLCPIVFSISDGRPFIRVSTSAISVFLAVGFFLLFEMARHRHVLERRAYGPLAAILMVAASFSAAVWFIDSQFALSVSAYCFFYDAWNTRTNTLEPGWLPLLAGAAYGAMVGGITMSIASGFMVIRGVVGASKKR